MKIKTSAKSSKKALKIPIVSENETTMNIKTSPKKFFVILALIILIGGVVFLGAKKYKGYLIAGKVNGRIVTRLELEKALNDRYGKQTFDDLAGSILVQQLATKNQVSVSNDEVNQEIAATEQRLGGKKALGATLDRMGYTQNRFKSEVTIQVLVKKLAEKVLKVEVTDAEIAKFYQDNKTLFPKRTLDQAKADIKQSLLQQKNQEAFTTWFSDQKKKATIQSYL